MSGQVVLYPPPRLPSSSPCLMTQYPCCPPWAPSRGPHVLKPGIEPGWRHQDRKVAAPSMHALVGHEVQSNVSRQNPRPGGKRREIALMVSGSSPAKSTTQSHGSEVFPSRRETRVFSASWPKPACLLARLA